jgi:hypothetical protein
LADTFWRSYVLCIRSSMSTLGVGAPPMAIKKFAGMYVE